MTLSLLQLIDDVVGELFYRCQNGICESDCEGNRYQCKNGIYLCHNFGFPWENGSDIGKYGHKCIITFQ